jgi:hypothetical protein
VPCCNESNCASNAKQALDNCPASAGQQALAATHVPGWRPPVPRCLNRPCAPDVGKAGDQLGKADVGRGGGDGVGGHRSFPFVVAKQRLAASPGPRERWG